MKNNEKFQTDVEMVPKALRDQAQTREPEEEAIGLYRKFTTTKQEPVRLAAALRGFFLPEAEDQEKEASGLAGWKESGQFYPDCQTEAEKRCTGMVLTFEKRKERL